MRRRQPDPIEVQQMRAQALKDQETRDLIRFPHVIFDLTPRFQLYQIGLSLYEWINCTRLKDQKSGQNVGFSARNFDTMHNILLSLSLPQFFPKAEKGQKEPT